MRTKKEIQEKIAGLEAEKDNPRGYTSLRNTIYLRQIEALKWVIGELEEL